MVLVRACLVSLLVPLHEATVPQQFKDIFGVTEDLPESTTQAPVQNWEDLTPEEQEAAKDGLISVVGAPANVVATAKHIMQEKARKEQTEDDFESGNADENEDDEEDGWTGKAPKAAAKAAASDVARAALADEATPMRALASTVAEAETEDSDADATDTADAAPAADARAGSLRGSAASETTTPMPDWPMPDLVSSATTTPAAAATSTTTSASSATTTSVAPMAPTTTSAAPTTSVAKGSFDVNSITRLHAMLAAAEQADARPPARAARASEDDGEDPGDEEPGEEDDADYDASVRAVSRRKAGLDAVALQA